MTTPKPTPSLEGFLAFCEAQGGRDYQSTDPFKCPVAQYAGSIGRFADYYRDPTVIGNTDWSPLVGYAIWVRPSTFPALAERLRAELERVDG